MVAGHGISGHHNLCHLDYCRYDAGIKSGIGTSGIVLKEEFLCPKAENYSRLYSFVCVMVDTLPQNDLFWSELPVEGAVSFNCGS